MLLVLNKCDGEASRRTRANEIFMHIDYAVVKYLSLILNLYVNKEATQSVCCLLRHLFDYSVVEILERERPLALRHGPNR